ncbi:MAG: hypothetical protein GY741_09450, partial [Phycisphaeraceae bacterium]|nr:hypothetical protein [Phycisphaeraceae bacterium]
MNEGIGVRLDRRWQHRVVARNTTAFRCLMKDRGDSPDEDVVDVDGIDVTRHAHLASGLFEEAR